MSTQGRPGGADARTIARSLRSEPGEPLHRQLEATLRRLIHLGEFRPGSSLPAEHELAAALGLSRHTVRHSLGVLAAEGLVQRQRGRGGGTRVLDPAAPIIERSLSSFYAFAWEVQARGETQRSFVLERTTIAAAPADLAERVGIAGGDPIERIVRLRTADGEPLVLETAYLSARLASRLEQAVLEQGSVYDAVERLHGTRIVKAHETIRPIALTRAAARLLGVRAGSPALLVERQTLAEDGPIEWQESIVRGDRYLYSIDLPRRR
ncbi:MAG TPA: GntR family transcriptional regulator [Chloroflexota bacterium]|nr:GntR family transcriptional regulator [Chloroflexota bacterium]